MTYVCVLVCDKVCRCDDVWNPSCRSYWTPVVCRWVRTWCTGGSFAFDSFVINCCIVDAYSEAFLGKFIGPYMCIHNCVHNNSSVYFEKKISRINTINWFRCFKISLLLHKLKYLNQFRYSSFKYHKNANIFIPKASCNLRQVK